MSARNSDELSPTVLVLIVAAICFAVIGGGVTVKYVTGYVTQHYIRTVGTEIENAKHERFRNSQPFVDAKTQLLSKLWREYLQAKGGGNAEQAEALRDLILSEADLVAVDRLPQNLRNFVHSLQYSTGEETF